MKQLILLIILTLTYFINYGQSFDKKNQKTVLLNNGFKIKVGGSENIGHFSTYAPFILTRNGKIIYLDSTNKTEYEFGDTLYPMIHKLIDNSFEILAEINDRPNKNYLKRFLIKNDKLIKLDTLPTFFCKAKNLDNDTTLEYAAIWEFGEEWDDSTNQRLTVYNPIIYYELTQKGLQLDSSLTIERNKMIYGKFYGYNYNERIAIKVSDLGDKLSNEIERIKGDKK
ncbi:MAG: hypothetical protein ACOYO1_19500 [Bacteroidales bacterium]